LETLEAYKQFLRHAFIAGQWFAKSVRQRPLERQTVAFAGNLAFGCLENQMIAGFIVPIWDTHYRL
jgi:hypothetical protein